MLLFCVVGIPGFIAGLGWGTLSALIATLSAGAIVMATIGPVAGAAYLATLGLPLVVLCYLVLLARPIDGGDPDDPASLEWYPPGRLVVWATVLAGCVAAFSVPLLGWDAESYRSAARGYFEATVFSRLPVEGLDGLDKEKLKPLIDLMVVLLPATSAMVWLGIMLSNMWAAGKIVESSGRAIRPWPQIAALSYPQHFSLGFFGATLLTFAPGVVGIIATGFAGAFLLAYVIMGLVVLHVVANKSPFKTFMLAILYLSIMLIGWVALVVAIIGLGEPIFRLRERTINNPKPPDRTGT